MSCTFLLAKAGLALRSVCTLGAAPWPCIVHRYARYARLGVELAIDEVRGWPEKSTGLEERRRLKGSGRSPDTYKYINTSRVTESQDNTLVWGSLKLAPISTVKVKEKHKKDEPNAKIILCRYKIIL